MISVIFAIGCCCRPYWVEYHGSHPNSECKQFKAGIVLGWVTAREVQRVDSFLICVFIQILQRLSYQKCLYFILTKFGFNTNSKWYYYNNLNFHWTLLYVSLNLIQHIAFNWIINQFICCMLNNFTSLIKYSKFYAFSIYSDKLCSNKCLINSLSFNLALNDSSPLEF